MCAGAVFFNRLDRGCVDPGMPDQTEIRVGRVHAHFPAVDEYAAAATDFLHRPVVIVQAVFFCVVDALVEEIHAIGNAVLPF